MVLTVIFFLNFIFDSVTAPLDYWERALYKCLIIIIIIIIIICQQQFVFDEGHEVLIQILRSLVRGDIVGFKEVGASRPKARSED